MTTQLTGSKCDGGHYSCTPPNLQHSVSYRPPIPTSNVFNPLFLGHWYFWLAVTATVAGILCACSLWKKHNQGNFCCGGGSSSRDERASEPDSNGSCYAPPQYSRCNSFHQAPPPYSEVTSKPDLYPLVISFNPEPVTKTNASTGYLMVQYFRNFIVRPVGTLSTTSTIDSLSSSFICNAANEANTIIPPPYSSTGSLDEVTSDSQFQVSSNGIAVADGRNLPHSSSFNSSTASAAAEEVPPNLRPSPSTESKINIPTHFVTPIHLPSSRHPSIVSIRQNPCFNHCSTRVSTSVPINENQPKVAKDKTQSICDASRLNRKHKLAKERSADSSENQEDEHNFSDLLNLSVCTPSGGVGAQVQSSSSTTQVPCAHYSVTNSMTGSDISSLANLGTPDSPPRATSPTMEMKEILDRIQQLPHQKSPTPNNSRSSAAEVHNGNRGRNYLHKIKAKTMYMPLYESASSRSNLPNVFSRGWLSRSAPTTPCSNFVPNFPLSKSNQKSSKTKITDGSPLLNETEESEEEIGAASSRNGGHDERL